MAANRSSTMSNSIVPLTPRRKPDFARFMFEGKDEIILSMVALIISGVKQDWEAVFVLPSLLTIFVISAIRSFQRQLMVSNQLLTYERREALVYATGSCGFILFIVLNAIGRDDYMVLPALPFAAFGILQFLFFRQTRRYEWE